MIFFLTLGGLLDLQYKCSSAVKQEKINHLVMQNNNQLGAKKKVVT